MEISHQMPECFQEFFEMFTMEPMKDAIQFQRSNFQMVRSRFDQMKPYFKRKIVNVIKKIKESQAKIREAERVTKKKCNIKVIIEECRRQKK